MLADDYESFLLWKHIKLPKNILSSLNEKNAQYRECYKMETNVLQMYPKFPINNVTWYFPTTASTFLSLTSMFINITEKNNEEYCKNYLIHNQNCLKISLVTNLSITSQIPCYISALNM